MDDRISKVIAHPATIPSVIGLVSFGVGAGLGFILGRRTGVVEIHDDVPQMSFDLDKSDLDELQSDEGNTETDMTQHARTLSDLTFREINVGVDGPGEIIEVRVKEDDESDSDEDEVSEVTEEPDSVVRNVFAASDVGWDYTEEVKGRNAEEPYVLHKDEFYEGEFEYSQVTLTYYKGDNIMADEDDTPVYNFEQVVGDLKFGHGSGDPKVFYVRNPKLRCEYEVLLHEGLFSVEVLGLEIEDNARAQDLKHSLPRFRSD